MSDKTANITIPIDLTNPGQFFACCGLLELADRLWSGAEGWFDGREFCIRTLDQSNSLTELFEAARMTKSATFIPAVDYVGVGAIRDELDVGEGDSNPLSSEGMKDHNY